jgi:hypothetical protein
MDALRRLRAEPTTREFLSLAMTAFVMSEDRQKNEMNGFAAAVV